MRAWGQKKNASKRCRSLTRIWRKTIENALTLMSWMHRAFTSLVWMAPLFRREHLCRTTPARASSGRTRVSFCRKSPARQAATTRAAPLMQKVKRSAIKCLCVLSVSAFTSSQSAFLKSLSLESLQRNSNSATLYRFPSKAFAQRHKLITWKYIRLRKKKTIMYRFITLLMERKEIN